MKPDWEKLRKRFRQVGNGLVLLTPVPLGFVGAYFGLVSLLLLASASCASQQGNPDLLIKDLERAGLRLGLEYEPDPDMRLEKFEFGEGEWHTEGLIGANFSVGWRDDSRLGNVHVFNPRDGGERKHLSVLDPISSNGKPLLNMSPEDVVKLYGSPSEIDEYDLTRFYTYYFKCSSSALVTVEIVQWPEAEPHTYPFVYVSMNLTEGDLAAATLMAIKGEVYDWPSEWTRGSSKPEDGEK